MGFERRNLLDQEAQLSDAATRRVPLPRLGALSGIELRTRITNGATSGLERVFTALDRIEVVADGSNVLFSLEGFELYRWAHHFYGKEPPHIWTEAAGGVQALTLPIPFGRFLGDPEFWLPLSNFRDVELRIQYSPTIAATGFVTATTEFHAQLLIDDNQNPPGPHLGYLRTTQVNAFTSLAAGDTIIELARMYPYWDLHVYAREAAIADGVDITRAQVWVNDTARIPFDGRWDDIQALNEHLQGVDGVHDGLVLVGDADTVALHTGRILSIALEPVFVQSDANGVILVNVGSVAGDVVTISYADLADAAAATHFTASAADRAVYFRAAGLGVGNSILIPFAERNNPDLALPSADLGRLQLVLTNGGADGVVRVSTRELVVA